MLPLSTKITGPLTIIGDLHGQTDLLNTVLTKLRTRSDFDTRWIAFVGDFVDRGPDTRGTLDAVLALRNEHAQTTAVTGNHDLALLGALKLIPAPAELNWPRRYLASYDSGNTFSSYGVPFGDIPALADAIPTAHKDFLASLPWVLEHPEYLIVHAGLLADMPFVEQLCALRHPDFSLNRPAWLCDRMLAHAPVPHDCPVTVVSGHVPVSEVTFGKRRILVDTTGGFSGELSAVLLPENLVVTSADPDRPYGQNDWFDDDAASLPYEEFNFGREDHDQ